MNGLASQGANLEWCRFVANAPGFAGELFGGKTKWPLRPLECEY